MIRTAMKSIYLLGLKVIPGLQPVYMTRKTQTPVPLLGLLKFRFGLSRGLYWPVHHSSVVVDPHRIHIGVETSPGLMPGCYIQGSNGIRIGDYTQIAAGVAIISANHSLTDNRAHVGADPISIGPYCWIGAHAVILPGVRIGPYTVVGAGAIVTHSFEDGYQVIAGNPARVIKTLDHEKCVLHRSEAEFHGFLSAKDFPAYKTKHLARFP